MCPSGHPSSERAARHRDTTAVMDRVENIVRNWNNGVMKSPISEELYVQSCGPHPVIMCKKSILDKYQSLDKSTFTSESGGPYT